MNINNLQSTCNAQQQQIVNAIQNKTIIPKKTITVGDVNVYIGDGWVNVTIAKYLYVLVYHDHTTDPNYNYKIIIVKLPNITIDCNGITIEKTDKNEVPAPDNTLPNSVMSKALSTLPTACGTGLWDGCTAGIQNKYLLIGGGLVVGLYFLTKGK